MLDWQFRLKDVAPMKFGRSLGGETTRLTSVKKLLQMSVTQDHVSEPHSVSDVEGLPNKPYRASDLARDSTFSHKRSNWTRYFQDLLSNTRSFSAKDPRDKVYAMFGLLKRALSASLSIVFTPSYSVDVITTSVFTSATSLSLDDIPRFETLPYVEEHSTTNIQEVPSWVPDYTRDLINVQLIRIRGPMHGFSFDPYPLEAASCSGRVSGGEFIVPGARFDHIVEVCHPMVDIIEEHGVHGFLELCQGASSEYFPRYSKPGEVLWWNIVADSFQWVPLPTALGQRFRYRISVHLALDFTIGSILHPEEEETVSRLDLNEAEVMESLALLGQLRKAGPTLGELCITSMDDVVQQGRSMYNPYHQFFVHRDSMPDTAEGDPTTPMSARYRKIRNSLNMPLVLAYPRRLYHISEGRIGLGSASLRVGDKVCLLMTAKVPFVLRPREWVIHVDGRSV